MKTNKKVMVITVGNESVLFNPLNLSMVKCNKVLIDILESGSFDFISEAQMKVLSDLKMIGKGQPELKAKKIPYLPTSVTILPSFDCNLRCVYCYSNGGENCTTKINMENWKAAVDIIINNAVKTKKTKATLSFHGGGEPLLSGNIRYIKEIVSYFRQKAEIFNINPNITTTTNGLLNPKHYKWASETFNYINFSFDGTQEIQDRQRPSANGKSSYEQITRMVSALGKMGTKYGFRTTITKGTVHKIDEIVKHFTDNFKPRVIHLEPLFECGRCATTAISSPSPDEFLKYYRQAKILGKKLGVNVYYSGDRLSISDSFCGAAGKNFFLNPEGYVTTCLEVCRKSDPHSEFFFIGEFNPVSRKIDFDQKKIDYLSSRTIDNMTGCGKCLAKYSCAGGCLAKTISTTGNLFDSTGSWNCPVNKSLVKDSIREKVDGEKHSSETIKALSGFDELSPAIFAFHQGSEETSQYTDRSFFSSCNCNKECDCNTQCDCDSDNCRCDYHCSCNSECKHCTCDEHVCSCDSTCNCDDKYCDTM